MMLLQQRRVLPYGERKRNETLITFEGLGPSMITTCVHDLKAKRTIASIVGIIARSYPLTMKHARGRWIAFREIVLCDDSGFVPVKIWGNVAIDLLPNQEIQLKNAYCFHQNGVLCLTLGIHAQLKICTQA